MNIDRHDQPEPARVLSGPLGLSAYRHKNLANRTVIDLMVFLFKKKEEREKKEKDKQKAKTKQEKFLIERHFDMHDIRTHTHTQPSTHESRFDLERARIRLSLSLNLRMSLYPCALLSRVLWTASQVKWKTHRWKLKQKWQMVYFSPPFPFCFLRERWLGPWGRCMEPGRMSLQGRGWTINKRLTSIDFAAGKKGNSWVCLSTICLAFTSFFSFAFTLFSLLCLSHTLFLTLSFFLDLRLMEKNCVLMRRQLYLPSLGVYFLASCLWYIWRLWSFKLLSIMHNYLKSFFSSLSLSFFHFVSYFNLIYMKIIAHIRRQCDRLTDGQTGRLTAWQAQTRNDRKLHKPSLMTIDCPTCTRICQLVQGPVLSSIHILYTCAHAIYDMTNYRLLYSIAHWRQLSPGFLLEIVINILYTYYYSLGVDNATLLS